MIFTHPIIAIRSFLFFAVTITYTVVYFVIVCIPVTLTTLEGSPVRMKTSNGWAISAQWLCRFFCGVNWRVNGIEHLDKTKPALLLSRHESALETIVFKTLFHPNAIFVLKKELLNMPIVGRGLKFAKSIAIDRDKGISALRYMLSQAKERFSAGHMIILFPEGTRTPHEQPGVVKKGACLIASSSKVPAHIISHDAGNVLPRKSWLVTPGTVTVQISPPYNFYQKDIQEIADEINQYFIAHTKAGLRHLDEHEHNQKFT